MGNRLATLTIIIVFTLCFLTGCKNNLNYDLEGFSPKIVVEGYIEEGEFPIVMLSQNKALSSVQNEHTVKDMVIRWAKVTVSDGQNEEILTGRVNKNYFPPFIYQGMKMRGEAGKHYTLRVEYSQQVVTAETYIPKTVPILSIETHEIAENDSLFEIFIRFDDPHETKNYYKLYSQIIHKNKRYIQALMGNLDDNLFEGKAVSVKINHGIDQINDKKKIVNFYKADTVLVKLCTLPREGFTFWKEYENELVNGTNVLAPANENLTSNIKNGIGIWCGYGKSERYIIYPQRITEKQ